ncbi:septation protein SepH, partial [Dietzia cinnamea]
MRKLRIIGVDTESSVVECEVPDSGEKFTLPLDDRFRAAARGEFVAGGSDRAPVTGTLRPREIQDRIRHGASPEEVAADAGVPLSRIEGFAVPVLLERANAAELARAAHPVLPDGPALNTLADRVGAALDRRGVDPDLVTWDAWKDRSGGWVVRTSWPAGLSDDASATWSFVPDSHGGSARALDEEAERILDPSRATELRSVSAPPPLPPGPPPIRAVPPPASVTPPAG